MALRRKAKKLIHRYRGFWGLLVFLGGVSLVASFWEHRNLGGIFNESELINNCEIWKKASYLPVAVLGSGATSVGISGLRIYVDADKNVSVIFPHHYAQDGSPTRCFKSNFLRAEKLGVTQRNVGISHSVERLIKRSGPYLEVYERGCYGGKCNHFTAHGVVAVEIEWYKKKRSECGESQRDRLEWCIEKMAFNNEI